MKKKILVLWLLAIAITLGSIQLFDSINKYFFMDAAFAKSQNLEIEYWVDPNAKELDDNEDSDSLLGQLRSQNNKKNAEIQEISEEIENVETESKVEKKSNWDKLLERSRSKKDNIENSKKQDVKKDKDYKADETVKEEQPINRFQDEIKKSKEAAKKKVNEQEKTFSDSENNGDKELTPKEKEVAKQKAIAEAKKEKEKEKKKEKERDKKENIVTMHIRCDTAVAKGMAKEPKWQGIVPPSGIILSTTKFKIKEGDTVLDVLVAAKEQYKFQMRYIGNSASAYIEGINNLYEFDGGRWSGWMYCVNDWYPNYGAGVYTLKGGDVIEWNYTCDLGKDLGQEWLGN